jgi:DNA polymerase III epsilon subunit-like protein
MSAATRNYFAELFSGKFPQFQGPPPNCYLVADTETSGLCPIKNGITQLAYILVHDYQTTDECCFLLQPYEEQEFHEKAVEVTGIGRNKCASEGIDRQLAFETFFGLWNDSVESCGVAGHNLCGFDYHRLGVEADKLKIAVKLVPEKVWDTGILVKAALQCGGIGIFPSPRETRLEFYSRVSNIHSKVKWNLKSCIQRFKLPQGNNQNFHDALFDCRMCDILLQKIFHLGYTDISNVDYLNYVEP